MENLERKLRIGLIEPIKSNAERIKASFANNNEYVDRIETIHSKDELFGKIEEDVVNTLVINTFSCDFGTPDLIDIVSKRKEKTIPICLIGSSSDFKSLFKSHPKFKSYCRIETDTSPEYLDDDVFRMSKSLFRCREEKILKYILSNTINNPDKTDKEKIEEMSELSKNALKLAEEQGKERNDESAKILIPGISHEALPEVIRKTLEKTTESIDVYKWVNVSIVVFGIILTAISLIAYCITRDITVLGFGGFGFAGIITSLITNPTSSIGKTARQMIQIQINYLSYLKQLQMIDSVKSITLEDVVKKCEQLNKTTNSLQMFLCEYFDSQQKSEIANKVSN